MLIVANNQLTKKNNQQSTINNKNTMQTQLKTYFEPEVYIDSLMKDIGFENAAQKQKEQMRAGLNEQISHLIINAISLYVEPEHVETALIKHGNLTDLGQFIAKLVEISPSAQMAIVEALDNFYTETVEAHEYFKQM